MPYVQRNESGAVTGIFEVSQKGYAEEFLGDDSVELQPRFVDLKGARIAELNAIAQRLADQAISGYPKAETLSWPDQAAEALAWAVDDAVPTPYMDSLALSRGLDRVEYLNRTVAKVASFKAFSAHVFGTRQKYADQIDAATNEAELNAIVFNFA